MIALNSTPFVRLAAGGAYSVPAGGWDAKAFAVRGHELLTALHRVSTAARMKPAAAIARAAHKFITESVDEALDSLESVGKARKKPFPEEVEDALRRSAMKFESDFMRLVERECTSATGQGYSKTCRVMGQKEKPHGSAARTRKARETARKTVEKVSETTRKRLRAMAERAVEEGYARAEMLEELRLRSRKQAPGRAKTIGRTAVQEAWRHGAANAYQENPRVTHVSVIACTSREEKYWGKDYYRPFMWPPEGELGDGRDPESCCNIEDVPIQFIDQLNWHPNHTGTVVPSMFEEAGGGWGGELLD